MSHLDHKYKNVNANQHGFLKLTKIGLSEAHYLLKKKQQEFGNKNAFNIYFLTATLHFYFAIFLCLVFSFESFFLLFCR